MRNLEKLRAKLVIQRARQHTVDALARDIVSLVQQREGITVDEVKAYFQGAEYSGALAWDISGALDIVTGFEQKTQHLGEVEIQRGKDGGRHLVLYDPTLPHEYRTPRMTELRLWLDE